MRVDDLEDGFNSEILHADRGHRDIGVFLEEKKCVRLGRGGDTKAFDDASRVLVMDPNVGNGGAMAILEGSR